MILPDPLEPAPGTGSGLATWLYSNQDQLYENAQTVQTELEATNNALFGQGVVYGSYSAPLVSAGTGVTANIAAFSALIGFAFSMTATTCPMPDDQASWIWLLQDGTLDVTSTATNPGETDNPAILLAKVTTASGAINTIDETVRFEVLGPGKGEVELIFAADQSAPYTVAWDGTVNQLTIPFTLAVGKPLHIYNARARMVKGDDYSASVSGGETVVTFASGAEPQTGVKVTVICTPA